MDVHKTNNGRLCVDRAKTHSRSELISFILTRPKLGMLPKAVASRQEVKNTFGRNAFEYSSSRRGSFLAGTILGKGSFLHSFCFRSQLGVHAVWLSTGIITTFVFPDYLANRVHRTWGHRRGGQMELDTGFSPEHHGQGDELWRFLKLYPYVFSYRYRLLSVNLLSSTGLLFVHCALCVFRLGWTYHQCVNPKLPGLPPDIADISEVSPSTTLINAFFHTRRYSRGLSDMLLTTGRIVLIMPFTII